MMQVCSVLTVLANSKRRRKSMTGMILPRRLMTPRMYAGICGTIVMAEWRDDLADLQ